MFQWPLCCQTFKRLVVDPAASTIVLDGFSSEKNANADVQGNYTREITGLYVGGLLARELFYMPSAQTRTAACVDLDDK